MRRRLYHAPGVARGADTPAFAGEGHKVVVRAVSAAGAGKALGKDTTKRWQVLRCMLLCLACGIVDAVGYLRHGIFAANMTGNTVLLGISLAQMHWESALERALPLLIFFAGAMLARLLLVHTGQRPWVPLVLASALIVVALAVVPSSLISLSLITFAMGIQATAMTQFAGITLSTVVITSTMARIAEAFADRLSPAAPEPTAKSPPLPLYLLTWGCYLAGALIAALGGYAHPLAAMAAAAILILMAAAITRIE